MLHFVHDPTGHDGGKQEAVKQEYGGSGEGAQDGRGAAHAEFLGGLRGGGRGALPGGTGAGAGAGAGVCGLLQQSVPRCLVPALADEEAGVPHGEQGERYEAEEPREAGYAAHQHERADGEDGAPEHDAAAVLGDAHELAAEEFQHL